MLTDVTSPESAIAAIAIAAWLAVSVSALAVVMAAAYVVRVVRRWSREDNWK